MIITIKYSYILSINILRVILGIVLTFTLKLLYNTIPQTCITTLSTVSQPKYSRFMTGGGYYNMKSPKSDGIMDLTSVSTIPNQDISICWSTHPLDLSISDKDIADLQQIYHNESILLQQDKWSPDLHLYQMLSHNSETTDISLNQFLAYLGNSFPSIIYLPTYFSSALFDKGWENIAHKYFLLPNSSACRGIQKLFHPPSCSSLSIYTAVTGLH